MFCIFIIIAQRLANYYIMPLLMLSLTEKVIFEAIFAI